MIAGSVIGGYGQAILWTAQGEYVSLCAKEETKGFYFGFFWTIYMSSQIIGNAIGGYIITKANGPVFFIIMFGIMLVAVLGFCFVILPPKQSHVDLDQMKLMDTNYKDDSAVPPSMLSEMKDTIALICTKKMMYLNMQLLWSGTSIAFWSAMLIPIMTLELADHPDFSENKKTSWALYGMVSFGFGEVIGGYIMGMVIDKCGSK